MPLLASICLKHQQWPGGRHMCNAEHWNMVAWPDEFSFIFHHVIDMNSHRCECYFVRYHVNGIP